ncbi:Peroxidase 35 [Hibiscus syriacus]|uniref:peroxidase n=1 Tax=Hibiscus syriacus TaxID=106335 RepID=A0A6A3CC14_HIBSY|nr:Peroxidase 35 [Hibiscus syriacus]
MLPFHFVHCNLILKFRQTFVTAPGTLRLFFHDCFVHGCDASVLLASANGNAEKDHPDDISLAGDGFDTVIKAKAAVDSNPQCRNKVSCADILALATRDVVQLTGGPFYTVELGRRDGRTSTKASVQGQLPHPNFNLDQLNSMFAKHGLSQTDMIALSGAHTLGFAHCGRFSNRIYNFSPTNPVDPTLNFQYAMQLDKCVQEMSTPESPSTWTRTHLEHSTMSTTRIFREEWVSSPPIRYYFRIGGRETLSTFSHRATPLLTRLSCLQ